MRRFMAFFLVMVLAFGLVACGKAPAGGGETKTTEAAEETKATEPAAAGETAEAETTEGAAAAPEEKPLLAEIVIRDYGTIRLALDREAAPETVDNFVQLAKDGFYDGLTFHRIIEGFMIQGGDPLGNGMGGSDKTIKGEFEQNGVKNPISHVRGTISMARAQDMDSASSQFFIVQADSTFLDGQYAGFGAVTEGMEIVDQICRDTQVEDDNGTVKPENQPVIESIRILE